MHCVNPIRCPTRCYLMLTLENYYANGCKRKRWRSVKLSKRYLRAPDDRKKNVTLWTKFSGGKSKLQTGNEFLKFTFEVEINISLYTLSPNLSVCYIDRWKFLATHNLSYGFMFKQKSIFFAVIFITRNTAFGPGSKCSKLFKKNMRDYKVMILMRKPVVSRRRNLVWRWDWKKKRAYLFGWSDLQITFWRRFSSISWSTKIIDGCLTIVCFFEN